MDIEEIKNSAKNKIEADDLTKQVRQRIKETAWEKQNRREGFSETFKPLISQFEKPVDPKKKNIFTQNQDMLRNQLALTEGLRDNQRAITQGFEKFERLADMRELPQIEDFDGENQKQISKDLIDFDADKEQEQKEKVKILDIEKGFEQDELYSIEKYGFQRPNDLLNLITEDLTKNLENLKEYIKSLNGQINGRSNKKIHPKVL